MIILNFRPVGANCRCSIMINNSSSDAIGRTGECENYGWGSACGTFDVNKGNNTIYFYLSANIEPSLRWTLVKISG